MNENSEEIKYNYNSKYNINLKKRLIEVIKYRSKKIENLPFNFFVQDGIIISRLNNTIKLMDEPKIIRDFGDDFNFIELKKLLIDLREIFNEDLILYDYNLTSDFIKLEKFKLIVLYLRFIKEVKLNSSQKNIINILNKRKEKSYIVGGYIRNTLYGLDSKDMDFVSEIPYEELEKLFRENNYTTKQTGKAFLVLNVIGEDKIAYEIANFRKDGEYKDGRSPETVEISNIFEDAMRRDFGINSFYYDIKKRRIIDPNFQAYEDLHNNVLRFIGNPIDRLKEDYLRAFRFYRFLNKNKNLKPDQKSLKAIRSNWKNVIENTNSYRILNEIERTVGLI